MSKRVKFVKFHDLSHLPGVGNIEANTLPAPNKTIPGLVLEYDGKDITIVKGADTFKVPGANIKFMLMEPEAPAAEPAKGKK